MQESTENRGLRVQGALKQKVTKCREHCNRGTHGAGGTENRGHSVQESTENRGHTVQGALKQRVKRCRQHCNRGTHGAGSTETEGTRCRER